MRGMADDWEAGGPVRQICRGYEDASSGAVIQLRLLAGVFRIVLTGRADQLLPYYPSLGGTAAPAEAWPVLREVIAANVDELHEALEIAPQTNEVGRSAALLAGLLDVLRRVGARLGSAAGARCECRPQSAARSIRDPRSGLAFRPGRLAGAAAGRHPR